MRTTNILLFLILGTLNLIAFQAITVRIEERKAIANQQECFFYGFDTYMGEYCLKQMNGLVLVQSREALKQLAKDRVVKPIEVPKE